MTGHASARYEQDMGREGCRCFTEINWLQEQIPEHVFKVWSELPIENILNRTLLTDNVRLNTTRGRQTPEEWAVNHNGTD